MGGDRDRRLLSGLTQGFSIFLSLIKLVFRERHKARVTQLEEPGRKRRSSNV